VLHLKFGPFLKKLTAIVWVFGKYHSTLYEEDTLLLSNEIVSKIQNTDDKKNVGAAADFWCDRLCSYNSNCHGKVICTELKAVMFIIYFNCLIVRVLQIQCEVGGWRNLFTLTRNPNLIRQHHHILLRII
jgi:hypothetical protein